MYYHMLLLLTYYLLYKKTRILYELRLKMKLLKIFVSIC